MATTTRSSRPALAALVAGLVIFSTAGACPASTSRPQSAESQAAAPTAHRASGHRSWPTARSTGAKGKLRTRNHGITITRDGATLRNVLVKGQITVRADDVTIQNVRVETDDIYGILVWGRHADISRTTIVGTPGPTLAGLAAYEKGSFHARRLDVSSSEDGVRLADHCSLRRSFVHGLAGTSSSHFDAVTADGYQHWRIVGNRILNGHDQTAAVWVGDPRYEASSGLMKHNLVAGGGYSIYAGPGKGAGVRVIDNRFSTRFHSRSGYWGPVTEWRRAGNTWSGNRWLNGPRKGETVHP